MRFNFNDLADKFKETLSSILELVPVALWFWVVMTIARECSHNTFEHVSILFMGLLSWLLFSISQDVKEKTSVSVHTDKEVSIDFNKD